MSRVKTLVKHVLYWSGYYNAFGALRSRRAPRLLVLMYHDFRSAGSASDPFAFDSYNPTRAQFEAQLREITRHYDAVGLGEGFQRIRNGTLARDSVAVTFDDGFESVYTTAFPALRKFAFPATVFLLTGWIIDGRTFWWNTLRG